MNQIRKTITNPSSFLVKEPDVISDFFAKFPGICYKKGACISKSALRENLYFIQEGKGCVMNDEYQDTLFVEQYIYEGGFANLETVFSPESAERCFFLVKAPTLIKKIPFLTFDVLLESNPNFGRMINELMAKKANANQGKVNRFHFQNSRFRILHYLMELVNERGRVVGFEKVIDSPPTHLEIADLSNTSRQTVTTLLSSLREKNIIHYTRRSILLRDEARLAEMMVLEQKKKKNDF